MSIKMIFTVPFKFTRSLPRVTFQRHFYCTSSLKFQISNSQIAHTLRNPASSVYFTNIVFPNRWYSSDNKTNSGKDGMQKLDATAHAEDTLAKPNQRARLKQAVRDYGATIIVFHVAISLASLGISYVAISNGVDAVRLLTFIGFSESVISSKVAVGGSTFVIAYAVHKVFAPVRIAITLSVAPFIVRYLRRINWLKPPKTKT